MSLPPSPQIHSFTGISSDTIYLGTHYCDEPGKEVHGERVKCYAEGEINVTGRYNGK